MGKARKVFAVHPGEILRTEFMEPMGLSAYALAKALEFPGIYEVVRGDRAISADTAIRLGKYFGLTAQFWLNLQNDYDLRIAEGSGVGRTIKPSKAAYDSRTADLVTPIVGSQNSHVWQKMRDLRQAQDRDGYPKHSIPI